MSVFDHLISKNNIEPKPIEYIYMLDMIWKPNSMDSVKFQQDSIVINVRKLENNSFEFECKKTGITYQTNYGWSLAENTPENVEKIKLYRIKLAELERVKLQTNYKHSLINTLES